MTNLIKTKSIVFTIFLSFTSCTKNKNLDNPNVVTLALSQRPSTLDPRFATDAGGMRISELIFQSLIKLDKNLTIQPSAAQSWNYNNLIYTFKIPKDITFSNGRNLLKEDIEFSFNQYSSRSSPFYVVFKKIKNIDIQETKTDFILKIKLKSFSSTFLSSDLTVLKLLPKKEVLLSGNNFHQNPIGSGYFKLISQDSNQIILESRNIYPLSNTKRKIKKVIFKIIRDDLTRFQKILKKEIDIVQSEMPYSKINALKKSSLPYHLIQKPGLSMNYLLINLKDPLFKNKTAREALAYGIDKQSIIKYKLQSMAVPALSILNSHNPFFARNVKLRKYNFLKAKNIIKNNSWNQKKISIKTSNNQQTLSYAKILAIQLRKIGFQVQLDSYEWGTFYGDLNKGHFQLALLRWVGAWDPDIYRLAFHSSQIPPTGRNRGFYINKKLDHLLDLSQKEENFEKRKKIYQKIQQIIAEDLPIIPLWHNDQIALVKSNIKGYFLPMNGSYDFLNFIYKE